MWPTTSKGLTVSLKNQRNSQISLVLKRGALPEFMAHL
jgi:hypothetical protein